MHSKPLALSLFCWSSNLSVFLIMSSLTRPATVDSLLALAHLEITTGRFSYVASCTWFQLYVSILKLFHRYAKIIGSAKMKICQHLWVGSSGLIQSSLSLSLELHDSANATIRQIMDTRFSISGGSYGIHAHCWSCRMAAGSLLSTLALDHLIYIDMLKVLSNSGTKSNGMEMAMGAKVRDSFPSLWLNRMFGGVNTDRYMKMGRRKLTTADTQFLAIVNLEDLLNSHAIAINYQTQYQWFFWYGNEVVLPRSSVCRWLQLLQALYQ